MLLVDLFLVVLIVLFVFWCVKRHQHMQMFYNMGIPGPKPHFLWGNFFEVKGVRKLGLWTMERWQKQYGETYGFFVGSLPRLVVKDLEMVKQVLVKDSQNFINRDQGPTKRPPFVDTLIGLRGNRWKDVRSILSPTFSSAKMKLLSGIMNEAIGNLLEKVDEKARSEEDLDVMDLFQRQTIDVIGESALAMKIDSQKYNGEHPLLSSIRQTFSGPTSLVRVLFYCFPSLMEFLMDFVFPSHVTIFSKPLEDVLLNVRHVVDYRRRRRNEELGKSVDVLQLMMDATDETDAGKTLTDDEIVANAFVFLLAGYETTSLALTYTVYLLTRYPDIQEKLFQELKNTLEPEYSPDDDLGYDQLHSLTYLDQVFSESLRIFPPVVTFVSREAACDTILVGSSGQRVSVKKGMLVVIPVWEIHHDPDLWPEPYEFKPDRFDPEVRKSHHPMAYLPFGAGPRYCIGMRFAMQEAKATLARLILKYKLTTCDKSEDNITFEMPTVTISPKYGVYVRAQLRTQQSDS